jgi:DNA (cytosine-5)-methyltransferase 1
MMNSSPTAIDLFAGCGGFSLGLVRAGYKVLAAVELDNAAADTYELNFTKRYGVRVLRQDITKLATTRLLDEAGIKKGELTL